MKLIITILLIFSVYDCLIADDLFRYSFQEKHMGTYVKIVMYHSDRKEAIAAATSAYDTITIMNQVMSDYLENSEINQLNNAPANQSVPVSPLLYQCLEKANAMSVLTRGAFDVTVGPFVKLWRSAREQQKLPDKQALKDAQKAVGYKKVILHESCVIKKKNDMSLDFGGIGKGIAMQAAMQAIKDAGIHRVLIDAGGDILVGQAPPDAKGWTITVGLFEYPQYKKEVFLENTAIASSGDLYQFLEVDGIRYSHIVDPTTGMGITGQRRSTVIGPDAAVADALASALCVVPAKLVKKLIASLNEYQALVFETDDQNNIHLLEGFIEPK